MIYPLFCQEVSKSGVMAGWSQVDKKLEKKNNSEKRNSEKWSNSLFFVRFSYPAAPDSSYIIDVTKLILRLSVCLCINSRINSPVVVVTWFNLPLLE